MVKRLVEQPASRLRFGMARVDITPPVDIYHRMWGAARHERATGVHRPLEGDVLIFEPKGAPGPGLRIIRAQLDHVGFVAAQHDALKAALSRTGGVPPDRVMLTYSHTHSAGWYVPDRFTLPGGELIEPYLKELAGKLAETCREAVRNVTPSIITYATGWCDMAANRDCWDDEFDGYVTGYNPDAVTGNTLLVGRVTDEEESLEHVLVHYACHPTTLAWENSLLSPDFVGAMREVVEENSGSTCTYLQGACGDIGPRDGHQGDTTVADRNGRQLAFAALSTLTSMGKPLYDFAYTGPVISGATLGAWSHRPKADERLEACALFRGGVHSVELPFKPKPDRQVLTDERAAWTARQQEADAGGDAVAARDYGARAERARRWLGRLDDLPDGDSLDLSFSVYRMGDAIWITCGGEPYHWLQSELSRRFPDWTVLVSPLDSGIQVAYLLPEDQYGKGLYQEEPSLLAKGCLEALVEAIAGHIAELIEE